LFPVFLSERPFRAPGGLGRGGCLVFLLVVGGGDARTFPLPPSNVPRAYLRLTPLLSFQPPRARIRRAVIFSPNPLRHPLASPYQYDKPTLTHSFPLFLHPHIATSTAIVNVLFSFALSSHVFLLERLLRSIKTS